MVKVERTSRENVVLATAMALAVLAGGARGPVRAAEGDAALRLELEGVARQRILFGHQSVGGNVLDGIRDLAARLGVSVRITETETVGAVGPSTLAHAWVGENGYPVRKLEAFERAFGPAPATVQIALVKFCYADITAETNVESLFGRYRATINRLQAKHPATTFVHVTVPLTDVQTGPKALVKWLLGRPPYGALENMRREEYNALLRQAFAGREPVFDLARVESTAPDGTAVSTEWKGRRTAILASAFTDDGSHLNEAGRVRAARELISVLASVPVRANAQTRNAN
jgi:hypothetical protein